MVYPNLFLKNYILTAVMITKHNKGSPLNAVKANKMKTYSLGCTIMFHSLIESNKVK